MRSPLVVRWSRVVPFALLMTILVPLFAVLPILAANRYPNLREGITITASIILILLVSSLYTAMKSGQSISVASPDLFPGLALTFTI